MKTHHVRLGMAVEELATPRAVVDLDLMEQNISRVKANVDAHKVALRPHIKTHKTIEIARMQLDAGASGITAAKPSEAAPFIAAGIRDVVIAFPAVGARAAAIAELASSGARVIAHADSQQAVNDLSAAAKAFGVELEVRVEIDTGFNRCGVPPREASRMVTLVEDASNLVFEGITTHRSAFFPGAAGRDPWELGLEEGALLVEVATLLRSEGHDVRSVVGGSTPTAVAVASVEGITEVCAGTYPFYDAGMAQRGFCEFDNIAMTILATVVSDRGSGRVTVDAGSKTLARDSYGSDGPFALTRDLRGRVEALSEEHGGLVFDSGPPATGEQVTLLPMHACVVANLQDELVIARNGVVVDVWQVVARGKIR